MSKVKAYASGSGNEKRLLATTKPPPPLKSKSSRSAPPRGPRSEEIWSCVCPDATGIQPETSVKSSRVSPITRSTTGRRSPREVGRSPPPRRRPVRRHRRAPPPSPWPWTPALHRRSPPERRTSGRGAFRVPDPPARRQARRRPCPAQAGPRRRRRSPRASPPRAGRSGADPRCAASTLPPSPRRAATTRGASSPVHPGCAVAVWTAQEHARIALQGIRERADRLQCLAQRHEARLQLFARVAHTGCRLFDGRGRVAYRCRRGSDLRIVERPVDARRRGAKLVERPVERPVLRAQIGRHPIDRPEGLPQVREGVLRAVRQQRQPVQDLDRRLLHVLQRRRRRGDVVPGRLERQVRGRIAFGIEKIR